MWIDLRSEVEELFAEAQAGFEEMAEFGIVSRVLYLREYDRKRSKDRRDHASPQEREVYRAQARKRARASYQRQRADPVKAAKRREAVRLAVRKCRANKKRGA